MKSALRRRRVGTTRRWGSPVGSPVDKPLSAPEARVIAVLEPAEGDVIVEEVETFGDEILQQRVREIFLWAVGKDRSGLMGYLEGGKIGMPHKLAQLTAGPFIALDARARGANDENVQAALAELPGLLQQVDHWIEAGVLGGPELNAADLQIAPSICLAMTLDDLRPFIEGRPAAEYARLVVPHHPGRTPRVLPDEWLEPPRQAA